MNDDLTHNGVPQTLERLPGTPSTVADASAPASIFDVYPRFSDTEVLGALRFLLDVEAYPAAWIETRAGLEPGAVGEILAGRLRPSDGVVRRLCLGTGMSRWLFFLIGTVKYGADLGSPELQWLIEERRRALAENTGGRLVELVVEATRLLFRIGGEH